MILKIVAKLCHYYYFESIFVIFEVIETALADIADDKKNCEKNKLCTINSSLHVLPWLSCQDVAMILPRSCQDPTSIPCIMISHDLGKGSMVNHELATLTMILASVPCLRSLG